MATTVPSPHISRKEKISIEPDLGDQRRSAYKALPSPPKTPKRVMMKYRFSGVFPLLLSLATFVLSLVVVLAELNVGMFEGQYLVALNTSRLGLDNIVTFDKAGATSTAPSASASASTSASSISNPLDPLNPFPTNSPLNPTITDSSLSNLTDAVNDGLGDAINGVVAGVVYQIGVKDVYYVYLQKICAGSIVVGDNSNADGVRIDGCYSYGAASDSKSGLGIICISLTTAGMSALSRSVRSPIVVGQTQVSIPLLAKLVSSLDNILGSLDALRKAILGFLITLLTGSILSAVSILPAMYFPQSRLLIYFNMFWPALAMVFAFLAAVLLSMMMVLASVVNGFGDTVGVQIELGELVLLFAWLSFASMSLVVFYWVSVWFVESRKSSFVKRGRSEDEIGHWRGIGREVWRDLKGRRRKPNIRADV